MWRDLPARVRGLHGALTAAAVLAVGLSLLVWGGSPVPHVPQGTPWQVVLTLGLVLSCLGSAWYGDVLASRTEQQDVLIIIASAFHLAATLLLPLPAALVVAVATLTGLQLRHHPAPYKQVFNASVYSLSMALSAAVFRLGAGPSHAATRLIAAAVAAAVVYTVVDVGAFVAHVWLAFGVGPRRSGLVAVVENLSQTTFGILVATLWATSPPLVLLLVPIGITLQRSVAFRPVERASRTDPKTGLSNDRAFRALAERELARAARAGEPCALLMLDLDHLRDINNTHGHLVGDVAIRRIADVLRGQLRDQDLAARFGGEEFAVLLPGTALAAAVEVGERVRRRYEAEVLLDGPDPLRASVSVGVATAQEADALDDVLRSADAALYDAKRAGRNSVRAAGGPAVPLPRADSAVRDGDARPSVTG
ncbi:MAG: diguanylate cyclase [Mycobacteriales bacterium]